MVQIHQMEFQDNPLARNFEQYSRPGINAMLSDFQEEKQYQKNQARQLEEWKPVANAYAHAIGKPRLAKMFEDLGPKATENLINTYGPQAIDYMSSQKKENVVSPQQKDYLNMSDADFENYKLSYPIKSREKLERKRENYLKQLNKKAPQTAYEKKKDALLAQEQIDLEQQIPKLESQLGNIDRIQQLSNNLRGIVGYTKAKSGLSADAAELDALGLASIEPIIKLFNPVGAIPTQKIELIKQQFAPKSTDFQGTIDGKLNALRSFTNKALQRATNRLELIKNGATPEELRDFDKQSEKMLDSISELAQSGFDKKLLIKNLIIEANGDKNRARQLAAERGIEF